MGTRKKVLVVGSGALFGSAVKGLLGAQRGDQVEVESVRTVEAAIDVAPRFQPDVIVFCLERDDLRDQNAWQRLRLMEVYPARVIRCTLESNHLTIYDTTRIVDATAEDLLAAVCDIAGSPAATSRKGEEA
jgi:DNA-binding NarL/FixJ family response regulator